MNLDKMFEVFYDTFQGEIDAQEFEIDESEWRSLFSAFKKAEKAARAYAATPTSSPNKEQKETT